MIVSYAIAAAVALLVTLCFAELASEVMHTGGTAVYATMTFGRAVGWLVAVSCLLEYVLSASSAAIGFSNYLATLFGLPGGAFAIVIPLRGAHVIPFTLDPVAASLVLLISVG